MSNIASRRYCKDCDASSVSHITTWIDGIETCLLPPLPRNALFEKLGASIDILVEKFFTILRLGEMRNDFTPADIQLRSTCFIDEAKKRGVKFKAFRGPFGYTGYFQAQFGNRMVRFKSLPIADSADSYVENLSNDKEKAKQHLKNGGFPIAEGRAFWFWQKKKAVDFGVSQVGFPLVVKPRSGSVSRHVTTDIQNAEKLQQAINKAIEYSPAFIVEKYIPDAFVYRATVIDFDFVACVKQTPANIVGDGTSTIRKLIDKKNSDTRRGGPNQKKFTLYRIVENEMTDNLLSEKRYNSSSIPQKNEIIYLQKDPFLKLGGDLIEETGKIHPDNLELFREIARFFNMRVVGIDFLANDISFSWKEQQCAVLELNSVPCIELHHFPSSGESQNPAAALADLFFRHYL